MPGSPPLPVPVLFWPHALACVRQTASAGARRPIARRSSRTRPGRHPRRLLRRHTRVDPISAPAELFRLRLIIHQTPAGEPAPNSVSGCIRHHIARSCFATPGSRLRLPAGVLRRTSPGFLPQPPRSSHLFSPWMAPHDLSLSSKEGSPARISKRERPRE